MEAVQDEFSHIQNKYKRLYARRVRDGKCTLCGRIQDEPPAVHCRACREKRKKARRIKGPHKPAGHVPVGSKYVSTVAVAVKKEYV